MPHVILKGPSTARWLYDPPRAYRDVDVLVPPAFVQQAADAYRQGVIVMPYSMALPIVLFLHSLVSRFGVAGDVEASLTDLGRMLNAMEGTLENKIARASAMLVNGTEELRGLVGKAGTAVARERPRTANGRNLLRTFMAGRASRRNRWSGRDRWCGCGRGRPAAARTR